MKRLLALTILCCLCAPALRTRAADDEEPPATPKEALQALNEFIGQWKGSGAPEKPRPTSREIWSEKVSWAWRFKGDDAWLIMDIQDGKYFKSGALRYLPDKKQYQLTAVDRQGKKQVFDGAFKDGYLKLERLDPATKETQQVTMNSAGDGVRFIYRYAHKPSGRTLFVKDYLVACTKEGESLGAREKKTLCVVSGGVGTMPVAYKGETFYVCCSGCRDAFLENPEKYIKEFKAKQAGKGQK